MTDLSAAHLRIARPATDLAAAERFWIEGVGLDVLWRSGADVEGAHALTMVGAPGAAWHLELVDDADSAARARPSEEDLVVLYLEEPPSAAWLDRIERAGGRRTASRNPYWDRWGVTVVDPDGYRLVLSERSWG
ncbi:VOC family protein [Nocardioides abyssi]|uniref:VOC family protein n=1 Tax=Nocardioides abyssi TaxID=3058370 RepID=A0ABT8EUL7_9ACTN|nr:VOC family protein [Nocardioides abyssi]MDN4161843.1 VOC family protein [Nocardioides abyssi]